ncbi:Proline--tRNA ligase [Carex littledalei]|uniref:Proline--tRNA ligase n=1 Tax=Carex littledalei TaxID=544730 RepID=A0A833VC69_9POAL|nr:Proline--tRNA ligase [Carex littledalei]
MRKSMVYIQKLFEITDNQVPELPQVATTFVPTNEGSNGNTEEDNTFLSNHVPLTNGVPLRLEIGPRDVTNKSVVVSRRTVPGKAGKEFGVSMEASTLVNYVKSRLEEIQDVLLQRAISFRDSNIVDVSSYGELKEAIAEGKWARGPWSASAAEELKVKKETSATLRCFPFEQPEGDKKCFMTGKPAEEVAIFAKSY